MPQRAFEVPPRFPSRVLIIASATRAAGILPAIGRKQGGRLQKPAEVVEQLP